MSNVNNIKNHLRKQIPKYIIGTMTVLFENKEVRERYVLPIAIEILGEIFGHGKKRLINKKSSSPLVYRNS